MKRCHIAMHLSSLLSASSFIGSVLDDEAACVHVRPIISVCSFPVSHNPFPAVAQSVVTSVFIWVAAEAY